MNRDDARSKQPRVRRLARALAATAWGPLLLFALTLVQPSGTVALVLGISLTVGVGGLLRDAAALRGPVLAGGAILVGFAIGSAFFGLGQDGGEGFSNPALGLFAIGVYFFAIAACLGVGVALGSAVQRRRRSTG